MIDITTSLEHMLQPGQARGSSGGNNVAFTEQADAGNPAHGPSPWPLEAEGTSPLTWWRRSPPEVFSHTERSLLIATLESISVLHGGNDVAAAMRGDAAAAINMALVLMPIEQITLQVDIKLTALLRIALDGNAAAALVMAQVIGLSDVGHEFTTELAASWLAYGERHSEQPRKFGEARIILLKEFEDRRNGSEKA